MNDSIQFLAALAGILGVIIGVLAFVRDLFNIQLSWSNSTSAIKRAVVNRWFLAFATISLMSIGLYSVFSYNQELATALNERDLEITALRSTQETYNNLQETIEALRSMPAPAEDIREVIVTQVVTSPPITVTQIITSQPITVTRVVTSPPIADVPISNPTTTIQAGNETIAGSFRDDFDGPLRPEWKIITSGSSTSNGNLAGRGIILYEPTTNNYRIKLRVKGHSFWLYFRTEYRGDAVLNAYSLFCNYYNNQDECGWYGRLPGIRKPLSANFDRGRDFNVNNYYEVVVEVRGRDFSVFLNDQLISSISDEILTSGLVGFELTQSEAEYFEVSPLP